jgi:hypothetical protein
MQSFGRPRVASPRLAFAAACGLAACAHAQTWSGLGTNNNLSTGANWIGGVAPSPIAGTANLTFAGSTRPGPSLEQSYDVNGVAFNTTVGFGLTRPTGSTNTLTVRGGGITSASQIQSIGVPVTFAASAPLTCTAGQIAMSVQPTNIGLSTVTATAGTGATISLGTVVGGGTIVKEGAGLLAINTPTGSFDLTVNAGTANPQNFTLSGSVDNPTALFALNGGTLQTSTFTLGSGAAMTRSSTATFTLFDAGEFNVNAGATATFTGAYTAGISGTYRVSGANSRWTTGNLTLSESSALEITAGGTYSGNASAVIGSGAGKSGSVLADGANSRFELTAIATTRIAEAGATGSMVFRNGAVGNFGGNTVRMADQGGTATLEVRSGAVVSANSYLVAAGSSGNATILVTGAGSTLTTSNAATPFTIGSASGTTAAVTVADGGEINLLNNLQINATGTLTIQGGSVRLNNNRTIINAGGTLNFVSGKIRIGDDLGVGAGNNLLGSNLTLAAGQEFETQFDKVTTVGPFASFVLDGGKLYTGGLVNQGGLIDLRRGEMRFSFGGSPALAGGALGNNVNVPAGLKLVAEGAAGTAPGSVLNVAGGSLEVGFLTNSGSLAVTSGLASIGGMTNSVTNSAGGTINLNGLAARVSGSTPLTNSGVVAGNGAVALPLTNTATGQIRADLGQALRFTNANAATNAGVVSLTGGTVDFTAAVTNTATGDVLGRGVLRTGGLTNSGDVALSGGVTDVYGDVTNATGGRVIVSGRSDVTFWDDFANNAGASLRVSTDSSATFFGTYSGGGVTGGGQVFFEADVTPGFSPALVTFGGDVRFGPASKLVVELGGTTPGSQYDQLVVTGNALLDGTLRIDLINNFKPARGDAFTILTGGSVTGAFAGPTSFGLFPVSDGSAGFVLTQTATEVRLDQLVRRGDVNLDGAVNNLDIAPFVAALTSSTAPGGNPSLFACDANRDGFVNNLDIAPFVQLLTSVGVTPADLAPLTGIVPEPAAAAALLGLAAMPLRRRRVR